MNEQQNQQQTDESEVQGYIVRPPVVSGIHAFRLPVYPTPQPPSGGTVGGNEGYSGGDYSGSSDPGAVDFGDAPVIRLF